MGIRTKLSSMGLTNRKKPFTDVMKYTVSVSDNGYVNLPVYQPTYTPDTVIKIDWGDGSTQQLEQGVSVSRSNIHQYTAAGEYQISISTESNKLTDLYFRDYRELVSLDSPILNINDDGRFSNYLFSDTQITTFPVDLFINNSQLVSLGGTFSNTNISEIPRGFTKFLPNLQSVDNAFSNCQITDYTKATEFLDDLIQYNKDKLIETGPSGIFQRCPFTTQLTIDYANKWYSLWGSLAYICQYWKVDNIPYNIINEFSNNTSLKGAFYSCEFHTIQLQPLVDSVTDVSSMFDSCLNLTQVQGTLGNNVVNFRTIFRNCGGLSGGGLSIEDDFIPSNVAIQSVQYMFQVTRIQEIPDTLFKGKNFTSCDLSYVFADYFLPKSGMFEGSSFSSNTRLNYMLSHCEGAIPSHLFDGCVVDSNDTLNFEWILAFCASSIPEDLFSYFGCWLDLQEALRFYNGQTIPQSLFKNLKISSFTQALASSQITQLPSKMFENCIFASNMSFSYAFNYCNSLTTVPTDLFDGFSTEGISVDFSYCFQGCSNITSAVPELWNRVDMNITSHTACFRGCTNAANYNDIPDDWK